MKTKFGSIIVAGSGKIGGHVASKNRGGSFLRTKVTPANARTSAQSEIRARFTFFSQNWRNLAQDQRDAWNAAVANYARTDIFGDLRNPSGANLYQRLNNILGLVGIVPLSLPPLPSSVEATSAVSLSAAVGIPSMSLVLSSALGSTTACIVSATAPLSSGKNSVNSAFRLISILDAEATTPVNLLSAYTAKFGSVGDIGQKIFVRVQPVNNETGQVGGKTIVSVVTSA